MPSEEDLKETEERLEQLSDQQLIDLSLFSDMLRGDDLDLLVTVMEGRGLKVGGE